MNEETTVPSEAPTVPVSEPVTVPAETEVPETTDGTVTDETFSFETLETFYEDIPSAEAAETGVPEETIAATEEVAIVDVIESVGSDIAHVSLFGSFLICGTLVGLVLLRDRYTRKFSIKRERFKNRTSLPG